MYSPARLATRCLSLQHLLYPHKSVARRWNPFHLNVIVIPEMNRKLKRNDRLRLNWHLESNWRRLCYRSHRPNLHRRRCTSSPTPAIRSSSTCWAWSTSSTISPRTRNQISRSNRTAAPSAKSTSPRFGSGKNRVKEEIQLFRTVQLEKTRRSSASSVLLAMLRRHLRPSIRTV